MTNRDELPSTDPETGLRRGVIRYPDGSPPDPRGCRWCGVHESWHGLRYNRAVGAHEWEKPTREQILLRMRARRRAKFAVTAERYERAVDNGTVRWGDLKPSWPEGPDDEED